MSLYQVAAPDVSSLARGGATLLLMEGLSFSADGKFLLVRGTFTDDADAVASTLHTGVWLYDVANQQYAGCLNALAVSAGVVASDLEISKAVIVGKDSAVYIAAEVMLRDNPSVTRLAYFQKTTLQQADILSAIVQDAALPAVQRMALSNDGRFLALQTDSAVLTPATSIDTDEVSDIYLLDLLTKKVELVTQVAGSEVSQAAYLGNVYTDNGVVKISFSSEGYFKSTDQNSKLSDNTAAARTDAYVWSSAYNLSGLSGSRSFDLVSLSTNGQAAGFVNPDQSLQVTQNGTYFNTTASDSVSTGHSADQFTAASENGRFISLLTNIPAGYAASEALQLQVSDLTLGQANVVSVDSSGALSDEGVIAATLSPNAKLVAFTSTSHNLTQVSATALAGSLFIATTGFSSNVAPLAVQAGITTKEDTAKTGTLAGTDANSDTLTFAKVADPSHGTVSVNATTGAYTYTPTANYNGTDSFTFKVNDGALDSETATVSITVSAVNDAPVATLASITTNEDTAKTGTLTGTDVEGSTLTFAKVADPSHGTVSVNATTGAYTYTPTANYNGTDSFTFKVNDGALDSETATVSITVASVNDAPVAPAAPAAWASGVTNQAYTFTSTQLIAGFTDVDGDTLNVTGLKADVGTLTASVAGGYTYTPPDNYSGPVTLTYNVVDGLGGVVPTQRSFTVLQKGIAQDGYVAKALVWIDTNADGLWTHESFTDKNNNQQVEAGEFVDANNNGVFDAESWDITDASGNFEGLSGSGNLKIEAWLYNANGLVPTVDLSTGKTFVGSLSAPGGSSVINPLTTLVQSAMASGKTEAQAQSLVRTALGVSEGVDLLSFDPVAQAQNSSQASEALKVQKAALQVANLMQVAVDTTAAAGATNLGSIVSSVATALVSAANTAASNTSSPTINLSNASLMASAISAAADTAFASSTDTTAKEVLKAQAQSIGNALSQVNTTIDTIVNSAIQAAGSGQTIDAASAMVNIVAAQIVANEQVSAQAQNSVVQAVLTGDTTSTGSISVNMAQSLELAKSKVAQVFVTQLGAAPLAVNNQVRLQLPGNLSAQRDALTESDNVLSNDTADAAYTKAISAAGVGAATSLTALANGTLTLSGSYGSLRLSSDGSFLYTEDKTKTASILANQSAQDVFTYELSDSTGTDTRKDTATLTIGLDRLNFAPSVQVGQVKLKEQGASVTGDGETLLNLLGLASDADGDTLSVSAVKVGTQALGNATSLATSYGTLTLKQGSYYYTPDQSNAAVQALGAGQSLKETVSFSVSDGVNSAVSGALQITLQGANDAPTLQQALADYRVTENRTLSVTVPATSFADVDDATLTYSAKLANGSALPSWMQFNASSRTFSISPGVDVVDATAQTFAVEVTATDGAGLSARDSFDVMVRPLGSGYDIQANVAFWKANTNGQKPSLAGVSINKGLESGTTTLQAGVTLYSVEDTEGADDGFMTLSPQASSPSNAKSAITLTDVLAALKVYLGKSLPDSYTSPMNYIAADFDANGTVNLTDVLTLLKYYLGKSTTSAPAWTFVDAADFSSDGKSLAGANSASINKTDTTPHAIDQSFDNGQESIQIIGVLRGDVDGSWLSP